MNRTTKAVQFDLNQAALVMEDLENRLKDMSLKDKVDLCARLRKATKVLNALDESVKKDVKEDLNGQAGIVEGHKFTANLNFSDVKRLNQKRFKEEMMDTWEKFTETKPEGRITFVQRS